MKRTTLLVLLLFLGSWLYGQKTIHCYSIDNWIHGPVVYISPLIETTEAFTTAQLITKLKEAHPEFQGITDIDVLRFATHEEGEEGRRTLKAKYGIRNLEVVMLDPPSAPAKDQEEP